MPPGRTPTRSTADQQNRHRRTSAGGPCCGRRHKERVNLSERGHNDVSVNAARDRIDGHASRSPAREYAPLPAEELMALVATGDRLAFAALYDDGAEAVFGMIRRILRDRAHANEVAQEVWLQVWQTASRFDAAKGAAMAWITTLAHRRAVDRVRSIQASRNREHNALFESVLNRPFDEVVETVEASAER